MLVGLGVAAAFAMGFPFGLLLGLVPFGVGMVLLMLPREKLYLEADRATVRYGFRSFDSICYDEVSLVVVKRNPYIRNPNPVLQLRDANGGIELSHQSYSRRTRAEIEHELGRRLGFQFCGFAKLPFGFTNPMIFRRTPSGWTPNEAARAFAAKLEAKRHR